MILTQPIQVFAPELSDVKDPTAGYFIAVRLDDFSEESLVASTVYSRKDFYKISLITGHSDYHYRGEVYPLRPNDWALVFTNTEIPYRWDLHEEKCRGFSCLFTEDFLPLHTHIRPADWDVFNGNAQSVFKLDEREKLHFEGIFQKMLAEQASVYTHKYDLLFLYVLECIHGAMKLQPATEPRPQNAAASLVRSFKDLLASQFPIAYPHQQIGLRSPQQFADKLAVHTNYLNRVVKEVTGKTTSQLLTERLMQEAHALVIHSNWTIGQISYSLGFDEPTHFARAFRNHTGVPPSSLRQL
ncbi:helix-turn-helix domain-containing protein [Dyadobacter luticola]|uniref:Helix-turn-helix domain-containing protein n=1 Tax=Dyadobacter luticola TaxID=1979387 RepID=A0A5R9L298_9BACT|nr:AraC family transcriptional regulator [Dyadobacter luticola]TLV02507.1 helix-turn-helix domain-containing protein [Dyadobacter luticola]